jgi:hypothetical protein
MRLSQYSHSAAHVNAALIAAGAMQRMLWCSQCRLPTMRVALHPGERTRMEQIRIAALQQPMHSHGTARAAARMPQLQPSHNPRQQTDMLPSTVVLCCCTLPAALEAAGGLLMTPRAYQHALPGECVWAQAAMVQASSNVAVIGERLHAALPRSISSSSLWGDASWEQPAACADPPCAAP